MQIIICHVLYCTVLSFLSCPVISCHVISCPVLSCPVLPQITKSFHQSLQIFSSHDHISLMFCTRYNPILPFIAYFVLLCYLFYHHHFYRLVLSLFLFPFKHQFTSLTPTFLLSYLIFAFRSC